MFLVICSLREVAHLGLLFLVAANHISVHQSPAVHGAAILDVKSLQA